MKNLSCAAAVLGLLTTVPAQAQVRSYVAERADQFLEPLKDDIVPEDAWAKAIYLENTAFDAALFGKVAVLTYNQMYEQAINRASEDYVGFNRFAHGRSLAGPGYRPFKTPNADTLYSNAYLDLSDGPIMLRVPPTGGRYYTVNFLDMFGNATNISSRTHGNEGGTFLIATTDWQGEVPEGAMLFRVTQPYMWILMRIEAENEAVVPEVRTLQDRFILEGPVDAAGQSFPAAANVDDPAAVLTVLDWIVRNAGVREGELATVAQFAALGVGLENGPSVAEVMADPTARAAIALGFRKSEIVLTRSVSQNGVVVGGNWREPHDIGRYGYNYLYRSNVNSLGTGANVRLENFAFTTFQDAEGQLLDGSQHSYVLRLDSPPPADFFWSITAYDRATQELIPNARGKYLVSDNTEGLEVADDGSITIRLAQDATGPNAIPIPDGPFYLALRAQGPQADLVEGRWLPPAIFKDDAR